MSADTDKLAHWLLGSIELDTAVFHVGQYCGPWRASTAGRALGSFHLVLHGECYLHMPGVAPIALQPRDSVFLLRDVDHFLSPHRDPAAHTRRQPMQPLDMDSAGTGLACGFFQFRGPLSTLIVDSFPAYLICRHNDPAPRAAATLFDLVLAEAGGDPELPSPLIARLVELLFFYLIRHVAQRDEVATGLLALAQRSEFAPLLDRMLLSPADNWSIKTMADVAHMSRASFCKHFTSACGLPPAQFLMLLRMKIGAQQLHAGESVERAAEYVGYRSHAAFTRAFKRVIGEQPGTYRREYRQRELSSRSAAHGNRRTGEQPN
jgi:AraC-like DNA-binding protein